MSLRRGAPWLNPAQPRFLALLRPLAAARDDVMHREMRDISADLKERAELLRAQIDSAQARFQAVISELNEERAIQRQRLESEVQAVHRLMHIVSIQLEVGGHRSGQPWRG
jgi:hypothetical protein